MNKFSTWPLALLLMLTQTAAASESQQILTLAEAEQIALRESPRLAASEAQARALAEVPPQVGALPDPQLTLGAMNLPVDSFSTSRENMTQMQVGLSQAIPFPGKLGLREQAARFEAEAATFNSEETGLVLVRNVRTGWWNLFYLDRALNIIQRNQVLLRQLTRIAETKYKVGKGLQQDVLLAQVELSKLLDVEISLRGARKGQEAKLNALLNRPAQTPISLPAEVSESLPEVASEAELHTRALAARPLLASRDQQIRAAETHVGLAEKDYLPDFRLGAAYGFRSGTNPVNQTNRPDLASMQLSLNLPIFSGSKQDRALAQRRAELLRSEYSQQDARDMVLAEVSQALSDYSKSRQRVSLFKAGIIPQASQTVASMLAGYQVNKVDFLNLVRAQVTLYNFETQYWQAFASANQSLAQLEASIGKEIIHE